MLYTAPAYFTFTHCNKYACYSENGERSSQYEEAKKIVVTLNSGLHLLEEREED